MSIVPKREIFWVDLTKRVTAVIIYILREGFAKHEKYVKYALNMTNKIKYV